MGSFGTAGYQDWQRVSSWDSDELFSLHMPPAAIEFQTPLLYVGRWAYLVMFAQVNTNPALVTVTWFTSKTSGQVIGTRQFALTPQIRNGAQLRMMNLGPWVQVTIDPLGALPWGNDGWVIGSNRVNPIEWVPVNPLLIDQQNVSFPAGSTVLYPIDYFAGPADFWSFNNSGLGAVNATFESLSQSNSWDIFTQVPITTTRGAIQPVVLPPGAWRISVDNGAGGAQGLWIAVTPSLTGSM